MKLLSMDEIQLLEKDKFDAVNLIRQHFWGDENSCLDVDEAHSFCNLSDVCEKMRIWKALMSRVQPFYAVKCNDDVTIVRLLANLGASFDCASREEIRLVLDQGVSPSDIIFANPCKLGSHIKFAHQENVSMMTFDSTSELIKIKQLYRDAKMVLRFRCDDKKALYPLGDKFGCEPKQEALHILQDAKNLDMNVIGVSFHVGSSCCDATVFREAISIARDLFDYGSTLGFKMTLLDIGGGFPGEKGTTIKEYADIINCALDDFFPEPDVKIIAEPGRFFVSSAYTLATTIHSKKETLDKEGSVEHIKYYLNDGVFGSFLSVLCDHQEPIGQYLLAKNGVLVENAKLQSASLYGPTCDGLDKINGNARLPNMAIGDVIYFENMGAYTLTLASGFNGFAAARVSYFIEKADWDALYNTREIIEHI